MAIELKSIKHGLVLTQFIGSATIATMAGDGSVEVIATLPDGTSDPQTFDFEVGGG